MFSWLFKKKSLEANLYEQKTVRVQGIKFVIKKINVTDHLSGLNVLKKTFDTYAVEKPASAAEIMNEKRIQKHYSEILYAGVVSPKLAIKKDEPGIPIDDLFLNWELVSELYVEIMAFTYGKKKTLVSK